MGEKHGKGESYEEDGKIEIGQWIEGNKQGEFECYDINGRFTHRKVYDDGEIIKIEEVKEIIYYKRKERNLWAVKDQTVPETRVQETKTSCCCLIF